MKYTIKPGITSVVDVHCDAFPLRFGARVETYIYMDGGKPVEQAPCGTLPFEQLPLKVRAAINRHFGTVFSLPLMARIEYMKNVVPWEVEA